MKKEVMYEYYMDGNTRIHIQKGNKKLGNGIYNISLLPGDKPLKLSNGIQLTNIPGTCKGCCKNCLPNCYAVNYTVRYHNTCIPAYSENTMMALNDPDRYFRRIQDYLNDSVISVFRFHVAGEIPNYDYLVRMNQLANNNPTVTFYFYSKRYKWMEKLEAETGFADNLIPLVSPWHDDYSNPCGFNEFIYDDGTDDRLKSVIHCPAVDKKGNSSGMTCAKCRRCFSKKKGVVTAVYAH